MRRTTGGEAGCKVIRGSKEAIFSAYEFDGNDGK